MKRIWLASAIMVSVGLTVIGSAVGDGAIDHYQAKRLKDAGEILPLGRILRMARQIHPGRILETELERKQGRYIYEIELINGDGNVLELTYDARTGELLWTEQEY